MRLCAMAIIPRRALKCGPRTPSSKGLTVIFIPAGGSPLDLPVPSPLRPSSTETLGFGKLFQ